MNIITKIIISGLLFLIAIVTGLWLSNSGKPLNTLIFTIHKLTALAVVIFAVILFRSLLNNIETNIIIVSMLIAGGLLVLFLFISGVLLSLGKPVNNILLTIHRVIPILTVITIGMTIHLLVGNK